MTDGGANKQWYYDVGGEPKGPVDIEDMRKALADGVINSNTLVFKQGMPQWQPLSWVSELTSLLNEQFDLSPPVPPLSTARYHRDQLAHEIDFRVLGEEMQYVEVELDPGEAVVAEAGGMMYMDPGIQMDTVFGDGDESQGVFDKLVGAGKRLLTGESLFMTVFSNVGHSKQCIAFASPYPGSIIPMNLAELGGELVCQKDAFLCAAKGVSISISFRKRLGVGLFGGEGFIMQKLEGDGLAFVHAGGTIMNRQLAAGEVLRVDTGCIVALESKVDYDVQYVGNVKSALFGGEGFFFATLTGPGNIWLQSLPFSRLAGRIYAAAPQLGGKDKGQGSLLGQISDISDIFNR